ncbi:MAG: Bug family tripartite tricarboxylate transporter substrate binding protein [Lautropia sp.]
MQIGRRALILATTGAATVGSATSWAQPGYPNRPVKIVVGTPSGSALDISARTVARILSQQLKQGFVVENKVGASGIISTMQVVKAPADGYTLLMTASGMLAVNPALYENLSYDPVRDLVPITIVNAMPLFLVAHPSFPPDSVAELIRYAKARPGAISYGSSGAGIVNHVTMEYFASSAGLKLVHVPYRGGPLALNDLMGGQIPIMFEVATSILPLMNSGRFKVLAVSGARRSDAAPTVPTVAESGVPGFEATAWTALAAPTGTPPDIVEMLQRVVVEGLRTEEVRSRFLGLGADVVANSPAEFAAFLESEIAKWGAIVRSSGAKAE